MNQQRVLSASTWAAMVMLSLFRMSTEISTWFYIKLDNCVCILKPLCFVSEVYITNDTTNRVTHGVFRGSDDGYAGFLRDGDKHCATHRYPLIC